MKKNNMSAAAIAALLVCGLCLIGACSKRASGGAEAATAVPVKGKIILSTTTSTYDSGLLDFLLPVFTAETGWDVDTIAVGTGAALQMGRDGQADVLLVHSKADEIQFVGDGYGVKRYDVMYNDFIVVGPPNGSIAYNDDAGRTFTAIAAQNLPFVSRGDRSGTHVKEMAIWKSVNIDPTALAKYVSTGQGMGATLEMANELQAYTLSDRATWLTRPDIALPIVCEKSADLLNYYGVIPVNPAANDQINTEGAQAFVDWMTGPEGQRLIGEFGVQEYGGALFTPNAAANR